MGAPESTNSVKKTTLPQVAFVDTWTLSESWNRQQLPNLGYNTGVNLVQRLHHISGLKGDLDSLPIYSSYNSHTPGLAVP